MAEQSKIKRTSLVLLVAGAFVLGLLGARFGVTRTAKPIVDPSAKAALPALQRRVDPNAPYKIPVTMSQPSLGPDDALVTFVLWCDLPDSGCAALDTALTALRAKHPGDVRVVFRHFAAGSDTTAHHLAQVAFQRGKFWEARERIQQHSGALRPADVERIAKEVGLDSASTRSAVEARTHAGHIAADRIFAGMFQIQAAPALFANGRRINAPLSREAVERAFEREAEQARKLLAQGVARSELYGELTKNGIWTAPPQALLSARRN
jgi:protein-disulfide isomerase